MQIMTAIHVKPALLTYIQQEAYLLTIIELGTVVKLSLVISMYSHKLLSRFSSLNRRHDPHFLPPRMSCTLHLLKLGHFHSGHMPHL